MPAKSSSIRWRKWPSQTDSPLHVEPHSAQAVVPVPAADERKPARAEPLQGPVDCPQHDRTCAASSRASTKDARASSTAIVARFMEITLETNGSQRRLSEILFCEPDLRHRVPPVVDGPVGELMAGMEEELVQRARRVDGEKDLAVLQLVTEPEGAPRLVVCGPSPEPCPRSPGTSTRCFP